MLSIQATKKTDAACDLHNLPCKISHNGPVNASTRHWCPQIEADGKKIAYFRGRKLLGRDINVPKGYKGVVLENNKQVLPPAVPLSSDEEDDDDVAEEPLEEVQIMEQVASFDKVTVWGHEALPSEEEDPYLKGVQEWMSFANSLHSHDSSNPA